jgi:transcriptional regulator with XRE-family HTH domain
MQNEGIGAKIVALRKTKSYTQSDLGTYLNISYQAVSKWERGEACPDFDTLSRIAKLFNVPISYFEESTPVDALATLMETAATAVVAEGKPTQETEPEKKMLGVCKECGKVVYEGDEGKTVPYLYCKKCNEKLIRLAKEKAEAKKREEEKQRLAKLAAVEAKKEAIARSRNKGLIWSAVITTIIFAVGIYGATQSEEDFWAWFGSAALSSVVIYTFIAQLFWDGFVVDAVLFGGKVVGTPGIIFEFSLDGFIFLIGMKILFALLRLLIWALTWLLGVLFALLISPFTFVPALIRVNGGDLVD